jgi:hypothetical protein
MTTTEELKLGFGMQGLGPLVTPYLEHICAEWDCVTYLEIGVGHGETLTPIAEFLRESVTTNWRAIGVELPDGYSFNRNAVRDNAWKKHLGIEFMLDPKERVTPPWQMVTVYLKDSATFLSSYWKDEIHMALIDGCHGKPCAIMDFLVVEPFIVPGGIVMMHDFGEDQIGQKQPHCENGINVRGAAKALRLMDDKRTGWKFMDELVGNKKEGAANMGVFQRLA